MVKTKVQTAADENLQIHPGVERNSLARTDQKKKIRGDEKRAHILRKGGTGRILGGNDLIEELRASRDTSCLAQEVVDAEI